MYAYDSRRSTAAWTEESLSELLGRQFSIRQTRPTLPSQSLSTRRGYGLENWTATRIFGALTSGRRSSSDDYVSRKPGRDYRRK